MSASRALRLNKELRRFRQDPPVGITVSEVDDDTWTAFITGPQNSPYEGGTFCIELSFPPSYPFTPPRARFKTPVYHPNVSVAGSICADIFHDKSVWSPANGVASVLLSVQSLLTDANPAHGLNNSALRQYIDDRERFDRTARDWTRNHAQPKTDLCEDVSCVSQSASGCSRFHESVCYVCMENNRCCAADVEKAHGPCEEWELGAVCVHMSHWTCGACAEKLKRCPLCRIPFRGRGGRNEQQRPWEAHAEAYARLRRELTEGARSGRLFRSDRSGFFSRLLRPTEQFHCPCGGTMRLVERVPGKSHCDGCLGTNCKHAKEDTQWWECDKGNNDYHPEGFTISRQCELGLRSLSSKR